MNTKNNLKKSGPAKGDILSSDDSSNDDLPELVDYVSDSESDVDESFEKKRSQSSKKPPMEKVATKKPSEQKLDSSSTEKAPTKKSPMVTLNSTVTSKSTEQFKPEGKVKSQQSKQIKSAVDDDTDDDGMPALVEYDSESDSNPDDEVSSRRDTGTGTGWLGTGTGTDTSAGGGKPKKSKKKSGKSKKSKVVPKEVPPAEQIPVTTAPAPVPFPFPSPSPAPLKHPLTPPVPKKKSKAELKKEIDSCIQIQKMFRSYHSRMKYSAVKSEETSKYGVWTSVVNWMYDFEYRKKIGKCTTVLDSWAKIKSNTGTIVTDNENAAVQSVLFKDGAFEPDEATGGLTALNEIEAKKESSRALRLETFRSKVYDHLKAIAPTDDPDQNSLRLEIVLHGGDSTPAVDLESVIFILVEILVKRRIDSTGTDTPLDKSVARIYDEVENTPIEQILQQSLSIVPTVSTVGKFDEEDVDTKWEEIIPKSEPINDVLVAQAVMDWLKRMMGDPLVKVFQQRLHQLAEGDRSYCLSKALKHNSNSVHNGRFVLYESKLDKGQRIIWAENRSKEYSKIIVFYISKHDKVPERIRLIDEAFQRQIIPSLQDASASEAEAFNSRASEHELVLIDPASNGILKMFDVKKNELNLLGTQEWKPPLHLTRRETELVNMNGVVVILGRGMIFLAVICPSNGQEINYSNFSYLFNAGGTGKSLVICNRMHRDRHQDVTGIVKQLFVSKSEVNSLF